MRGWIRPCETWFQPRETPMHSVRMRLTILGGNCKERAPFRSDGMERFGDEGRLCGAGSYGERSQRDNADAYRLTKNQTPRGS